MSRNFSDWLPAFLDYSSHIEAPKFMRFWSGVSTVAGALRRRVWIDNFYFRWSPNFFIIFVAPPGIVTKSTTADIGMELLQAVPDIHFGPNSITWQALLPALQRAAVSFEYPRGEGEWHPMSAITLISRELGSLIDPKNGDLINLFIELWDGSRKYEKETKMSGNDLVECPWVNMLGATTPSWIANNVPQQMLGGGFISRCVFLYAEEKEKFVAYPGDNVPPDIARFKLALIQDLEHMAVNLVGEYKLTDDAKKWGKVWYEEMWKGAAKNYSDDQVMGYLARKQTHVHKLAMVLAAARRDELIIDEETLKIAEIMLGETEQDSAKVFAKIGKSQMSLNADKLVDFIRRNSPCSYQAALRYIHTYFPDFRDFEGVLAGLIHSDMITLVTGANGRMLVWNGTNGSTAGH